MNCGCKGAQTAQPGVTPAAPAELAGTASIAYNVNAMVVFHPCADCAKDGAKAFSMSFSVGTGSGNDVDKRMEYAVAGIKAAAEAAKAAHEAH